MKRSFRVKAIAALFVPAISVALAAPSIAADADKTDKQMQVQSDKQTFRDMRASKLIGMNVKNAQNENLGEIKDLVIDVNNERVHYAILEFGGFLGLGEKLFAYPVGVFKTAADKDELTLNVDKERLKAAPGFARDNWPDWNSATYRGDVDRYYGETIAVKPKPNQLLRRASDLIGKDVKDRNGKNVGEIKDVIVKMGNGNIHYVVLEFDKSWNLNDKLIAVPMRGFTFPADKGDLVMNVDRDRIDAKLAFDKNRWPDINDQKFVSDIDQYLVTVITTPSVSGAPGTAGTTGEASPASPPAPKPSK